MANAPDIVGHDRKSIRQSEQGLNRLYEIIPINKILEVDIGGQSLVSDVGLEKVAMLILEDLWKERWQEQVKKSWHPFYADWSVDQGTARKEDLAAILRWLKERVGADWVTKEGRFAIRIGRIAKKEGIQGVAADEINLGRALLETIGASGAIYVHGGTFYFDLTPDISPPWPAGHFGDPEACYIYAGSSSCKSISNGTVFGRGTALRFFHRHTGREAATNKKSGVSSGSGYYASDGVWYEGHTRSWVVPITRESLLLYNTYSYLNISITTAAGILVVWLTKNGHDVTQSQVEALNGAGGGGANGRRGILIGPRSEVEAIYRVNMRLTSATEPSMAIWPGYGG